MALLFSYRQKQKRWLSRFRYWNSLVSFPFLPPQRIPSQHSTTKNNLTVVIPGGIRKNGRDYGLVIQLIEKLPTTMAIELVFLGVAGSHFAQRFLKSMFKIKPITVIIVHFNHYVPENLFTFYMQRATFLWIPLIPFRYYGGVIEKVGFSAITGVYSMPGNTKTLFSSLLVPNSFRYGKDDFALHTDR